MVLQLIRALNKGFQKKWNLWNPFRIRWKTWSIFPEMIYFYVNTHWNAHELTCTHACTRTCTHSHNKFRDVSPQDPSISFSTVRMHVSLRNSDLRTDSSGTRESGRMWIILPSVSKTLKGVSPCTNDPSKFWLDIKKKKNNFNVWKQRNAEQCI